MKPTKPRGLHDSSVQDLIQTINSAYNCPVRELESLINLALSPLVGDEPSGVGRCHWFKLKKKLLLHGDNLAMQSCRRIRSGGFIISQPE